MNNPEIEELREALLKKIAINDDLNVKLEALRCGAASHLDALLKQRETANKITKMQITCLVIYASLIAYEVFNITGCSS